MVFVVEVAGVYVAAACEEESVDVGVDGFGDTGIQGDGGAAEFCEGPDVVVLRIVLDVMRKSNPNLNHFFNLPFFILPCGSVRRVVEGRALTIIHPKRCLGLRIFNIPCGSVRWIFKKNTP